MRTALLLAAASCLLACSPPSQPPPSAPPAPVAACNALVPDLARRVTLAPPAVAAVALPPELPGGPIAPGLYDLARGSQLDADAWRGAHAVALEVSESAAGVVFNWAEALGDGDAARWTASFHQGPPAQLVYSCGKTGETALTFDAGPATLSLSMPAPSGEGRVLLVFERRA